MLIPGMVDLTVISDNSSMISVNDEASVLRSEAWVRITAALPVHSGEVFARIALYVWYVKPALCAQIKHTPFFSPELVRSERNPLNLTSNQARLPAEFKHIIKRRKRN